MKKLGMALVVSAFVLGSAPAFAADASGTDYWSCPLLWPIAIVDEILHLGH